ncbi:MAG: GNAT family N-acetyltransferase [Flavobacteriia bacterium]|jgi:ribosomal-protein-alanine N-acetyltransferase
MKTLQTQRLYLREFTIEDATHFYDLNLDPEVIKHTGDEAFKSIAEAKIFLENYDHYQKYRFGRWAVIDKSNEEFLGWCGLKYSPEKDEVDLGFRFFQKYWNKGFASEAAQACLNYGFNELNLLQIVGRAMKENAASIRVLEKVGMKFLADFDFDGNEGVIYKIEKDENEKP